MTRHTACLLALFLFALPVLAAEPDAVTPDGGRYFGALVDGKLHGRGRIEWADGTRYEGEFRQGMYWGKHWKFHGRGRLTDPRGTVYEGEFVDGMLRGNAVVRHANGDVYEGGVEYGTYHGQGTLRYAKPRPDGRTQDSGVWQYGRLSNDEQDRRKVLAEVETALYRQQVLLDNALSSLRPGQPGRTEMYLLAVAGDGSQEVFRREVQFVEKAFAERFGTGGRSVALINSRSTLTSAPMATVTGIRAALQAIAGKMNRDEDILFLFLTSHGSREHELTLDPVGADVPGLRAAELGRLLKESGITWKVVVISACYSGGFIDALKDERTLVITAARKDRRSFGCADENDFTYFGRAFFKEALPGAGSFQQAFSKAAGLVGEWERNEAKDERSLPQMHSAAPIEAHLKRWWPAAGAGAR